MEFTNGEVSWDHLAIFRKDGRMCVKFEDRVNGPVKYYEDLSTAGKEAYKTLIGELVYDSAEEREEGSTGELTAKDISDELVAVSDARVLKEADPLPKE